MVAGTFAGLTRARNRDYWSDESLWLDTLNKRPRNALARVNYGINLMKQGRYLESEALMRTTLSLETDRQTKAKAILQLGSALCAQGKFAEGVPNVRQALELDPAASEPYFILGEAYSDQGDLVAAMPYFDQALKRLPDNAVLLSHVSWLLATTPDDRVRNGARAVDLGERAVRLTRGADVIALRSLAAAYAEEDRFEDAAATAARALETAHAQGNETFASELERVLRMYQFSPKTQDRQTLNAGTKPVCREGPPLFGGAALGDQFLESLGRILPSRALREDQPDQVVCRIHPRHGAVRAAVGKDSVIADHPAKAIGAGIIDLDLGSRSLFDRLGRQDLRLAVPAAVQVHLQEFCIVHCRGNHAAGSADNGVVGRVVGRESLPKIDLARASARRLVHGRHARELGRVFVIERVGHPQRFVDPGL